MTEMQIFQHTWALAIIFKVIFLIKSIFFSAKALCGNYLSLSALKGRVIIVIFNAQNYNFKNLYHQTTTRPIPPMPPFKYPIDVLPPPPPPPGDMPGSADRLSVPP